MPFFKFSLPMKNANSKHATLKLSRNGPLITCWSFAELTNAIWLPSSTAVFRWCLGQGRSGTVCLKGRDYFRPFKLIQSSSPERCPHLLRSGSEKQLVVENVRSVTPSSTNDSHEARKDWPGGFGVSIEIRMEWWQAEWLRV